MQITKHRPVSEVQVVPERLASGIELAIRTRIAAVRAALESLAQRESQDATSRGTLERASEELARLGRDVRSLLDHVAPHDVRPLSCSLEEISSSMLHFLPVEVRARLLSAVEGKQERVHVDGPLLARALARLVEAAMADESEMALFSARSTPDRACFSFVRPSRDEWRPTGLDADVGLELGVELARRDLERIGGSFSVTGPLGGEASWTAWVPLRVSSEDLP